MKEIFNQRIIQIDITNQCFNTCTNCTRFCGHHKKPFHMTALAFKHALKSLDEYTGVVGVMGGEPTLHPDIKLLMRLMRQYRPESKETLTANKSAISNLGPLGTVHHKQRCGLFTANLNFYVNNYAEIQRTFGYQLVSDHTLGGTHVPLLIPRKELGIPDDTWEQLRDNCWVQNYWSASITPKGAFFCEIAAAMDMLFDGPGGWPITLDWWHRYPSDYKDQLHWCELCSACLAVPVQNVSNTEPDLVSPEMYNKLKEIGSPKLANGGVKTFDVTTYDARQYAIREASPAQADQASSSIGVRGEIILANMVDRLSPKTITALLICVNYADYLDVVLTYNKDKLDRLVVITDEFDMQTPEVCKKHDIEFFVSKQIHRHGAVLAKGSAYNECIAHLKLHNVPLDWILFLDADIILPPNFRDLLYRYVLNTDMLYYARRWWPVENTVFHVALHDFIKQRKTGDAVNHALYKVASAFQWDGYFQLINVKAESLKGLDHIYPSASTNAAWDDSILSEQVFFEQCVRLPEEFNVLHIPHNHYVKERSANWYGRVSPPLREVVPSLFDSNGDVI